jgi:hypothetical protein
MGTSLARRCALRETKRLPLKRAVELSTLFGFWFLVSRFHPNRDRYRDRYRDRLFNHGTHGTHGKAWLCFRVVSVFRGSNQKLRSTPNRCGADLNGSQCLQAFAQNPHAQLPFLGLLVFWLDPSNRLNTCPSVIQKTPAAHRTAGVHLLPLGGLQNPLPTGVARASCPCFMGGTPMPREVLQDPSLTYYLLLCSKSDARPDALFADLLFIRPDQLAGA